MDGWCTDGWCMDGWMLYSSQSIYEGSGSALPCSCAAALLFSGADADAGTAAASPGHRLSAGPAGRPAMPLAVMVEAPAQHPNT